MPPSQIKSICLAPTLTWIVIFTNQAITADEATTAPVQKCGNYGNHGNHEKQSNDNKPTTAVNWMSYEKCTDTLHKCLGEGRQTWRL